MRIGLVEDQGVVREGLCALLNTWPETDVAWTAGSGEGALEKVSLERPDLILMDISLPGMSGIAAAAALKSRYPTLAVLMLTVHDTTQHIRAALRANADGYILKDAPAETLRTAIARAVAGDSWVGPQVPEPVEKRYDDATGGGAASTPLAGLTVREREVVTWVARGETSRQIGARLEISSRTVEKHKANAMEKLGVHTSAGLAAAAAHHGLA